VIVKRLNGISQDISSVIHCCGVLARDLHQISDKMFRGIIAEMDINGTVQHKIKVLWRIIGIYADKYRQERGLFMRKHGSKNLD
jgi:hypothetical protein